MWNTKENLFLCCGSVVKYCGKSITVMNDLVVEKCPSVSKLYGCGKINGEIVEKIMSS